METLKAESTMMEPKKDTKAIVVRIASIVVMGDFVWDSGVSESCEQSERASGKAPFGRRIGRDLGEAADGGG